jgi:hypothetical protein
MYVFRAISKFQDDSFFYEATFDPMVLLVPIGGVEMMLTVFLS